MEQYSSRPQRTAKIAIILLIILFNVVIITITIIKAITAPAGSIEPVSTANLPYISQVNLPNIEKKLDIILKSYYKPSPEDLAALNVIIRGNTFNYKLKNDDVLDSATFLIDLNNPQLTYQVEYHNNSSEVFITCPPIELAQNQDIFCIGLDSQSTIEANLDKYLPYRGSTPSGVSFSIKHDYDKQNLPRLDVYANICGDERKGKEVEETVLEWVKSKGIPNPKIIPIYINYQDCYSKE